MKLLTIDTAQGGNPGVVVGDNQVLNLTTTPDSVISGWRPASIRDVLERGDEGLEGVKRIVAAAEADMAACAGSLSAFADTDFAPPVPNPWLIFSVGMNYGRHLAEMGDTPRPAHPAGFIKTRDSLLGSGKAIQVPPQCPDMIDYEGEFCFVFGRECHRVSEADAMDYVAGYTIANDVSARDWIPDIKAGRRSVRSMAGSAISSARICPVSPPAGR